MELPAPLAIVGMLLFSAMGWWAVKDGRRNANIKVLILGFILFFYSYFTPQTWMVWLIGTALTVAVFMCRD